MISAMNAAENTALDCAQADNSLDNEAMMQVSEETISGPDQFEGAHHRVFDLRQILLSLVLLFSMCGAYCMAFVATIYGYVALSPTPLVIISHALHLGLYALKNCGFICEVSTAIWTLASTSRL